MCSSDINIFNYADDNCISFAGSGCFFNGMVQKKSLVANPAKFQTMLVKSNNIDDIELNVIAENVSLPSSDKMKVLGIDIDNMLTFDGHVSNMCIKAGKQLNALQRLKGSLHQDSRMAIYKSFIMSNFNHCPVIWIFTSKTSLSKLENIQKRALRFVLMTIRRAILICYRMLTYQESKLWSYDISQLKSLNVLTKLVLLTSVPCSHASNVRMHWGIALYW